VLQKELHSKMPLIQVSIKMNHTLAMKEYTSKIKTADINLKPNRTILLYAMARYLLAPH
jgi:hypothetical protein